MKIGKSLLILSGNQAEDKIRQGIQQTTQKIKQKLESS
jgi:hypothetical protein